MIEPSEQAAREMRALLKRATHGKDVPVPDLTAAEIIDGLRPFITERRQERIDAAIEKRTNTVIPVVEGIINTGNVSAVMRSAEALGYHQFHIIQNIREGQARFKSSERTSQGAEKWLDVHLWDTPAECTGYLKKAGYEVVVTHLDDGAVPISDVDFTEKTALVFGNERDGATEELLTQADRTCIVPMDGFTQSFNISVAAAVGLYHARQHRLASLGQHGDLSKRQKELLRATYFLKSVNRAGDILRRAHEIDS